MNFQNSTVVIVVPMYKEVLSPIEDVALNQLYSVLGNYPICYIAPKRLSPILDDKSIQVEYFADNYFVSTDSYSVLLMSEEFYSRFQEYEYMLIYQLDAFVFSDQLLKFCNMGYDYIGAPWPCCLMPKLRKRVGNGGLSLRKIESCLRMVKNKNSITNMMKMQDLNSTVEDVFFAFCGNVSGLNFSLSSVKNAADFSLEWNISHRYEKLSNKLPFGCHGIQHLYYFFKPYIEPFILENQKENFEKEIKKYNGKYFNLMKKKSLMDYVICRMLRTYNINKTKKILKKCINENETISIWGFGYEGKLLYDLLLIIDCKIHHIYDKNARNMTRFKQEVIEPTKSLIENDESNIYIANFNNEAEIFQQLIVWKRILNQNLFLFSSLKEKVFRLYVKATFGKI